MVSPVSDEDRAVRTELREETRKENERKRSEDERITHDENKLLLYKSQINGSPDMFEAGAVLQLIHALFNTHPQYLKLGTNRGFS